VEKYKDFIKIYKGARAQGRMGAKAQGSDINVCSSRRCAVAPLCRCAIFVVNVFFSIFVVVTNNR
jgi:hypothetical protein